MSTKKMNAELEQTRITLSNKVATLCEHTIIDGPFRGVKLLKKPFWGEGDLACKILGCYEQEVLEKILELQKQNKSTIFVDVGAADGYYPIGLLTNHYFESSIVFEASEPGRNNIKQGLHLNNCTNKIQIHGAANSSNLIRTIQKTYNSTSNMVILIDIEGAEYELFDEEVSKSLHDAHIIIEIHDEFNLDKYDKTTLQKNENLIPQQQAMYKRLLKYFDIEKFFTAGRDLSKFDFLRRWTDNERALLISESRTTLGQWWHLKPKSCR